MLIGAKNLTPSLVGSAVLLGLAIVGRPFLVPLVFALMIWAVFNALTAALHRLKLPFWLAWSGSLVLLSVAIYVVTRIIADEAVQLAAQSPMYLAKLQQLVTSWLAFLHIDFDITDLVSRTYVTGLLGQAATSAGGFLFGLGQVLLYVGFLLAEQQHLPVKLAKLHHSAEGQTETREVIRAIAHQLQSYIGICTVLSAVMAIACYAILTVLGVSFPGSWSLVMFVLSYVPAIGTVGVVLPALMALVQYGTLGPPLIILVVLGGAHFFVANVVATAIMRRTLDLSPFVIILSLTFWGLVWGVAGLFLAVPMTGGIAIVCSHIEGLQWVAALLAAPPEHARKPRPKT